MDLRNWKFKTLQSLKETAKKSLRSNEDVTTFSEDVIESLEQEIMVEDYSSIVEDFEEIDLIEEWDLEEDLGDLQEIVQFTPDVHGSVMDIEAEIDLSEAGIDVQSLGKIRDLMFAEDYEIEFLDEAERAKIIFKRAQGKITKKKKCGPGMRLSGNRCIPQMGSQKAKERVKGIKLKRAKKAMGTGKKKKAAVRAKITKKRVSNRARNFSNIE